MSATEMRVSRIPLGETNRARPPGGGLGAWRIAAVYAGTVVGAAFATGQEPLRFFACFGARGLAGAVLSGALLGLFGWAALRDAGGEERGLFGSLGLAAKVAVGFFLLGGLAVMLAGAGALFEERLGLPFAAGSGLMAAAAWLSAASGAGRAAKAMAAAAPALFLGVAGAALAAAARAVLEGRLALPRASPELAAAPFWAAAAVLYASYNAVLAFPALAAVRKLAEPARWGRGMAAAAALLAGVALAACAGIFAGGEGALASEVPLVAAADALGPAAGAAYSAAVVAAIYTTAVGYLMGIGEVASGKIGRGAAAAAACAGAFAAAQAGFSQLVRSVFPAAGALGLALVGWAFWRAAARHLAGLSDRAVRRLEAAVSPGLKRRLERVLEALADRPAHSYPQVSRLVVTAGSLAWLVGAQIMKPEGVNLPAAWWVWSWGMAYCVLMWLVHRWLARSFLRGGAYLFGFVMDIVFACLAVWATGGVRSWFFPMAYLCVINSAVYFGARGAVVTAALAAAGYAAAALAGSGWRASAFEALTLLALVVPYFFYFGTYTAGEAESEKAQRTLRKRFAALYGLSRRTAENPDPDEARAVIQGILREHLEALDISVVLSAERPVGPAPEDVEREIVVVERGGVWSAAAPMAAGKDRFGVLAVSCGRKPEPDELELVAMLANHMGLVLKNRQMLDELKALAYTDALTGLANHRRFQEKLAEEAERSRRYGSPFSLLLVDIDHFKKFNDTYGHRFGDLALREVAQALRRALRGADFAARYGGEELAVILPETDLAGACAVAERICREVRSLDLFDPETGARARVTVSVGVAEFAGDRERLVREADAALYAAKRAGRDTWRAFRREATECGAAV